MTLLQISEPGESIAKEACRTLAVGIDLGTTNTLVACVRDGSASILCPEGELELIPSVVHYGDKGVVVGADAAGRAAEFPETTISSAKRFVGRSLADVGEAARMLPYRLNDGGPSSRVIRFEVGDRRVTPIEVSAEILREAKRRAETVVGSEVSEAVITVPAYFDDAQRQATRDAGRLAGLEVMRLLAEPTAAALAYGLDKGEEGVFVVYDLGGGTFDVSILRLVDGVFEVKATGGDSALGGDDFDRTIARRFLDEAGLAAAECEASLLARLNLEARAAKERLTKETVTLVSVDLGRGKSLTTELSRESLAELMHPLLERTSRACRRALKDAGLRKKELDGVILVGGSTRSPVIRSFVAELFGTEPLADINPDQVVALGAANQAHMLSGGESDVLLLDVIPLSLGIETMGGVVEKLIVRNSTIPTRAKQTFTTYADNQTGFDIHVVQGERETVDACRSLARFTLRGIPPMVAGLARVEIVFAVDADGLLRVRAQELTTGLEAQIDVKPSYGLTDEEVEQMLLDSFEHAEGDLSERNLRLERVEAERILAATKAAMEVDAELLDDAVRIATDQAIVHLQSCMTGQDHVAIRKAIEALDYASKPFAEKRMNRAVRGALKGRAVEQVEQGL